MIDVVGFAADCRLWGRLDLGAGRLTDLLNVSTSLRLVDVRLESLADGHALDLPELDLDCDELLAVVAGGPRGDPSRRLGTRSMRVSVETPPYWIRGDIHSTPASDPITSTIRRSRWVPLTDATLSYVLVAEPTEYQAAVLIVNRARALSIKAVIEILPPLPGEVARERVAPGLQTPDIAPAVSAGAPHGPSPGP